MVWWWTAGAGLCPDLLCDPGQDAHPLWATPDRTCSGPISCGPPDFGLGGRLQASRPSPSPERRLLASPPTPLWKLGKAEERMGALGLQTRPRPSPAPARVGEGWVPAPRPRPRAR